MATTSTDHKHDDYWKIPDQEHLTAKQMKAELDKRNYIVTSTAQKAGYREHLRRSARGNISYDGYTDDQLRDLIRVRAIHDYGHGTSRRYLLRLLKDADDKPKFSGFKDLPPEIRNRIYGMYYAEFTRPIYAPTQPPLTRACRLTRHEALQMFYSACTFKIVFHRVERVLRQHNKLQVPNQLLLFFYSTPAANLALIRRFEVQVIERGRPWHLGPYLIYGNFLGYEPREMDSLSRFRIELPEVGSESTRVIKVQHQTGFDDAGLKKRVLRMKKGVNGVVAEMGKRKTRGLDRCIQLKAEDVLRLRTAAEKAYH